MNDNEDTKEVKTDEVNNLAELADAVNKELDKEEQVEEQNVREELKSEIKEEIKEELKSELSGNTETINTVVNDISTKQDDNEPTGFEDVNKKGFFARFWWIFLIVLLLAGGAVYYFFFYNKNTEPVEKEKPLVVDNGVNIPKDVEVKEFYSELGSFYYYCIDAKNTENKNVTTLRPNNEVDCHLAYSLHNSDEFKVSEIYFELYKGKEITVSEINAEKSNSIIYEGNKYKLTTKKPSTVSSGDLVIKLKVGDIEEASSSDLYINIKNLIFKTTDNKYYSIKRDVKKDFTFQSNKYYLYNCDGELCVDTQRVAEHEYYDDYEYLTTYQCDTNDCAYIDTDYENYVLFKDGDMIVFDYKKNKVTTLTNLKDDYTYYDFVSNNNKLYGIICSNLDEGESYYSITQNKLVIKDFPGYIYHYDKDDFITACDEEYDECSIYTLDGKDYTYTTKNTTRIANSSFYFKKMIDLGGYIIINSDNELYNDGEAVSSYGLDEENNLIVTEETYFKVLNNKFESIHTSNTYDEVYLVIEDKILVFNENKIFLVNPKDETLDIIKDFGDMKVKINYVDYYSNIEISVYDKESAQYDEDGERYYTYYFYKYDLKTKNITEDVYEDYDCGC